MSPLSTKRNLSNKPPLSLISAFSLIIPSLISPLSTKRTLSNKPPLSNKHFLSNKPPSLISAPFL